jgi:hypothetical protein
MALALPVLSPGSLGQIAVQMPQNLVLAATDTQATTPLVQGMIVLLCADTDCWFAFGQAAVVRGSGAVGGSTYLPAKVNLLVKVPSQVNNTYPGQGSVGALGQNNLHAIGTAGNLCITPMVNQ